MNCLDYNAKGLRCGKNFGLFISSPAGDPQSPAEVLPGMDGSSLVVHFWGMWAVLCNCVNIRQLGSFFRGGIKVSLPFFSFCCFFYMLLQCSRILIGCITPPTRDCQSLTQPIKALVDSGYRFAGGGGGAGESYPSETILKIR
jgi:hypothetical protein